MSGSPIAWAWLGHCGPADAEEANSAAPYGGFVSSLSGETLLTSVHTGSRILVRPDFRGDRLIGDPAGLRSPPATGFRRLRRSAVAGLPGSGAPGGPARGHLRVPHRRGLVED